MRTVMGVFKNLEKADMAYTDLVAAGFDQSRISAISRDTNVVKTEQTGPVQNAVGGGATGAVAGGAIGGLAGILVAAGTLALPGVGGLLIGGPLVAALGLTGAAATAAQGALTGAAAGGILGALTGLGMPTEIAQVYNTRLSEGGVVVSVNVDETEQLKAEAILSQNEAEGVVAVSGR